MKIVRRGVSLGIFFVIWVLAGSAACWAEENIISSESDESIVVLEIKEGQKVQLVCKTEAGERTWVFVNVPELVSDTTFLFYHGFLFPLLEDSSDMYFSESPSQDRIDLGLYELAPELLPMAITTRIGDSSYQTDVVQTIVLIPNGYDEREEFLIDPDSLKDEDGRNTTVGTRTNGQRKAVIVHVNSGMKRGIALRCYKSSTLEYSGFKNLADAVHSGNNFLSLRALPGELEGYPENPTEIMEIETEESLSDFRGCTDVKKGGIRISVCPTGLGVYYCLRLYINGTYRITLYRACNHCSRFNYNSGLSHAQLLVNSLQGWN
jgi:hypothetical protein